MGDVYAFRSGRVVWNVMENIFLVEVAVYVCRMWWVMGRLFTLSTAPGRFVCSAMEFVDLRDVVDGGNVMHFSRSTRALSMRCIPQCFRGKKCLSLGSEGAVEC